MAGPPLVLSLLSTLQDQSTDVTRVAQLRMHTRGVCSDDIKLSFCFASLWKLQRLQEILSDFVKNAVSSGRPYVRFVYTQPLTCWVARHGFQALIKTVAPNAIGIHCVIHRQVLAAGTSPSVVKLLMSLRHSNSKLCEIHCFKFRQFHQGVL